MPEPTFLDTNLLVYALYGHSQHHQASRAVLTQAEKAHANFCVAAQSFSEFYAVVTNPRRVSPAKDSAEALAAIEAILSLPGITLIPNPTDLIYRWMELVRRHPVTSQHVFDVQLVATMMGNGIRRILTFNTADFAPFPDSESIRP